tara:strand:+ start:193 stop:759 length:567 start_codon:yes stop_codon:yes gene_type:complete
MGWEVWHDEGDSYGRIGFFCNTADVSFGPVIYTGSGFDKAQFYELWEKAHLPDARTMDETSELGSKARHIVRLSNWEDLLIVTMKVYKSDGKNAPVKIFDTVSKECFQNSRQSPFHLKLESFFDYEDLESDKDDIEAWDFICEAVEDLNDEMEIAVISESDENTLEKTMMTDTQTIKVVFEWEVLDEY